MPIFGGAQQLDAEATDGMKGQDGLWVRVFGLEEVVIGTGEVKTLAEKSG